MNTPKQEAAFFNKKLRVIPFRHFKRACDLPINGVAQCHIQVVTDEKGNPMASPSAPAGFGPNEFHTAYNLPCTPGGVPGAICNTPVSFGPQTIGIVTAYNAPNIESDLNIYSQTYGLPPCTKANGCLTVVNQNGTTSLPSTNASWALETSLDVETAHMICQTCKILLVEATSNSLLNLATAVNRAAIMGATSISNSYGAPEWSGETFYDNYYNHPGVAVTASSGDNGYGSSYPAAAPGVVAVGGTTLQIFSDNSYSGETAWKGAGSGCSTYETANSFQTGLPNWNQTLCGTKRAIADISADADPNTGAAIYDSTPYSGSSGWWIVGGTSLSSPLIAGVYALTGGLPAGKLAANILYTNNGLNFHDVTNGSNGSCGAFSMCNAISGYDGPTGVGTPNGIGGFSFTVLPTSTPTPTLTPTPTSDVTPTPTDIPTETPTPTNTPTPTPTNIPTPTSTPTPTPAGDTTAPVVSITSPANNSFVRQFSRVTINATASDNVKVTKVEVSINGGSAVADTTSLYSWNWNVPFGVNRKYTITAKAYDAANNTSTSSITVTSN